jgi:ketosteroid isomerase-like protein
MAYFVEHGEPLWSVVSTDVVIHDHDLPDADEYVGHEGYARWLTEWADVWSQFQLDPREYLDEGKHVVVVFDLKATGRGSGVEVEREDALVIEMRDGIAVRMDYFNNRAQAMAMLAQQAGAGEHSGEQPSPDRAGG